jgi:hypothetical protein
VRRHVKFPAQGKRQFRGIVRRGWRRGFVKSPLESVRVAGFRMRCMPSEFADDSAGMGGRSEKTERGRALNCPAPSLQIKEWAWRDDTFPMGQQRGD